jgi:hypothetical protein
MVYQHAGETGTPSGANAQLCGDAGERTVVTRMLRVIALGLWFGALGACAPMQSRPVVQVDPGTPSAPAIMQGANEIESLLQYYTRVKPLSGSALRNEQEAQRRAFAKEKSDVVRVQLALALSISNNTDGNDARAIALLDPLVKDAGNGNASLRNLAVLVTTLVGENRRLNDSVMPLKQKLRDEQKETEALQQKLEALKTLEKKPIGRDNRALESTKK